MREYALSEAASWIADSYDWWKPEHRPSPELKQGMIEETVKYYHAQEKGLVLDLTPTIELPVSIPQSGVLYVRENQRA